MAYAGVYDRNERRVYRRIDFMECNSRTMRLDLGKSHG